MRVDIVETTNEDHEWEEVEVRVDGQTVAFVCTSYDCPEDNSVSRLGLADCFKQLAEALGAITVGYEHKIGSNDE